VGQRKSPEKSSFADLKYCATKFACCFAKAGAVEKRNKQKNLTGFKIL